MLGPLEVVTGGRQVPLGGPKQRALLALFVLHRNEVIARDRLIEAVWGDRPPPGASRSLDSYISRLRAQLGAERVVRQPAGYLLRVEPGACDLDRFDGLMAKAAALRDRGDVTGAARTLRDALALWRGPALGDLRYEPGVSWLADALEERRLDALEQRFDADLKGGTARRWWLRSTRSCAHTRRESAWWVSWRSPSTAPVARRTRWPRSPVCASISPGSSASHSDRHRASSSGRSCSMTARSTFHVDQPPQYGADRARSRWSRPLRLP